MPRSVPMATISGSTKTASIRHRVLMRDQRQATVVILIHVGRTDDGRLLARARINTDGGNAGEGRELLLVGAGHIDLARGRTVTKGRGAGGLHQGFGEGAIGAGSRSGNGAARIAASRTASAERGIGRNPRGRPATCAGWRPIPGRTRRSRSHHLDVGRQLDALQHLLTVQFRRTAGLLHHIVSGRHDAGLDEDLAVVADAGRDVFGAEGRAVIVTFQLVVGGGRRGQRFSLPFVEGGWPWTLPMFLVKGSWSRQRDRYCLPGLREYPWS
jgi:hypothetical protein